MYEITLENYRCFRERQTVRLAPLTLLVGENSAGKTSFMAMIQVLLDMTYNSNTPNFKKSPFDLGSFDEIAHYRGGRGGRADKFKASFNTCNIDFLRDSQYSKNHVNRFDVEFGRGPSTVPIPVYWRLSGQDTYIEAYFNETDESPFPRLCFGTSQGSWQLNLDSKEFPFDFSAGDLNLLQNLGFVFTFLLISDDKLSKKLLINEKKGAKTPSSKDWQKFLRLAQSFQGHNFRQVRTVFAGAPVRSKPLRTYDPAQLTRSPEGDYIPMYMANVYFANKNDWKNLRNTLTKFGQGSGLFDEISIKPLGKKGSDPFQLQIRKYGTTAKGPSRNLIDVGYGVSQVLPIITELSRSSPTSMYLLQQPEVHLHPSAQAALGSFFCQVAHPGRALVVETHSDYILDRVRMEVRDGKLKLKPEDVSILFFERKNLGAQIHSLKIDDQGNILDAPDRYREFFMEETRRSLGL